MADLSNLEMLPDSFEPLPEGWHEVEIEKIETKTSAKGNDYLAFTLSVIEGEHIGRKAWDNFHLWHPSTAAVETSQRRIGSLFKAAGFASMGQTDDLLGKLVQVRLGIRAEDSQYRAQNEVKDYRSNGSPTPPSRSAKGVAKNDAGQDPWAAAA